MTLSALLACVIGGLVLCPAAKAAEKDPNAVLSFDWKNPDPAVWVQVAERFKEANDRTVASIQHSNTERKSDQLKPIGYGYVVRPVNGKHMFVPTLDDSQGEAAADLADVKEAAERKGRVAKQ